MPNDQYTEGVFPFAAYGSNIVHLWCIMINQVFQYVFRIGKTFLEQ